MNKSMVDQGWLAMETLLDEHMPTEKKRRTPLYLILLGALLATLLLGIWLGRYIGGQDAPTSAPALPSSHTVPPTHPPDKSTDAIREPALSADPALISSTQKPNTDNYKSTSTQNKAELPHNRHSAEKRSSHSTNRPKATGSSTAIPSEQTSVTSEPKTVFIAPSSSRENAVLNSGRSKGISDHATAISQQVDQGTSTSAAVVLPSSTSASEDVEALMAILPRLSLSVMPRMKQEKLPFTSLAPVSSDQNSVSSTLQLYGVGGGFVDDRYAGLRAGVEVAIDLKGSWSIKSGFAVSRWHNRRSDDISIPNSALASVTDYTTFLTNEDLRMDRFIDNVWFFDIPLGLHYQLTPQLGIAGMIYTSVPLHHQGQRIAVSENPTNDRSYAVGQDGLTTDDFVSIRSEPNWDAGIEIDYLIGRRWALTLGYQHGLTDNHRGVTVASASSFAEESQSEIHRSYFSLQTNAYRPRLLTAGLRFRIQ